MAKRILVADDERTIARLIQMNLERAGYAVETVFDGTEVLERVAAEPPDLLIMDVMMPYMDGFEALETLKKNPETQGIPVIMMTGQAQQADMFRGWLGGVDAYLTKPVNPAELLRFIRRVLKEDEGVS